MSVYRQCSRLVCILTFLFVFFFAKSTTVSASILLNENFDSYEGTIPNDWIPVDIDGSGVANNFKVVNGRLGVVAQRNTVGEIVAGLTSWTNYVYELDMISYAGDDRNVVFRWKDESHRLEFHITGNTLFLEKLIPSIEKGGPDNPYPMPSVNVTGKLPHNMQHHFTITLNGRRIVIALKNPLVDEVLIDYVDNNANAILNGAVGLRVGAGAAGAASVWFDNVKVTSIKNALNVPYFSQNDAAWNQPGDIYDHNTSEQDTISKWGCALTSTAMVLNYYGIDKFYGLNNDANQFPDGTPVNPGTLNDWLITQADGYNTHGSLVWWSVLRIANKSKEANYIDHTLKFNKPSEVDFVKLDSALMSGIPDILRLAEPLSPSGAHYAVATGVDQSNISYYVNDPFFERELIATDSSKLESINRYTPTNTNQSYIVVQADYPANILVTHESGVKVGSLRGDVFKDQVDSWFLYEKPLNGYVGNSVELGSSGWNEVGIPEPLDGNYRIEVTGSDGENYHFEAFFYNKQDDPTLIARDGILVDGKANIFQVNFSQDHGANEESLVEVVDFDRMVDDIVFAQKQGWVKSRMLTYNLLGLVRLADYFYPKRPVVYKAAIRTVEKLIEKQSQRFIDDKGKAFLLGEVMLLKEYTGMN